MKKILSFSLYTFIALFGMIACNTEADFDHVDVPHVYSITDDVTDSIQHMRYELYKTYGVPVYFNDTIAQIYLRQSHSGDSVFRYETLDLPWRITGRIDASFTYQYLQTDSTKANALRFLDTFLANASAPLRPFSILVVDQVKTSQRLNTERIIIPNPESDRNTVISIGYYTGTRTLLFTGIDNPIDTSMVRTAANKIVRAMIKQTLLAKTILLTDFFVVSNKDHYNKAWNKINADFKPGVSTYLLTEGGATYYKTVYEWSDAQLQTEQAALRAMVGAYGFVSGGKRASVFSPADKNEDLELFIDEALRYNPQQFAELWGTYPLVMKKYEIVRQVIQDHLQYAL